MPRTFEDYFETKAALVGAMGAAGDEMLVRRSGTVFNNTYMVNRAYADMEDNAVLAGTTSAAAWVLVAGFTDQVSTASLTFAADQYTYSGPNQTYPCKITVTASVVAAGTDDYELAVFLNAAKLTKIRFVGSTDHIAVALVCMVPLTTGDVIDVRIRNVAGTDDCTVVDAHLAIEQSL